MIKILGPNYKAPRPDGFSTLSFQKYWRVVKREAINMVRRFFETGFLLKELNHINIVLIPKIQNPTMVTHFRLISLSNVAYKIISKLLAFRLKRVISKLISNIARQPLSQAEEFTIVLF